jgi:hypothetical protein
MRGGNHKAVDGKKTTNSQVIFSNTLNGIIIIIIIAIMISCEVLDVMSVL